MEDKSTQETPSQMKKPRRRKYKRSEPTPMDIVEEPLADTPIQIEPQYQALITAERSCWDLPPKLNLNRSYLHSSPHPPSSTRSQLPHSPTPFTLPHPLTSQQVYEPNPTISPTPFAKFRRTRWAPALEHTTTPAFTPPLPATPPPSINLPLPPNDPLEEDKEHCEPSTLRSPEQLTHLSFPQKTALRKTRWDTPSSIYQLTTPNPSDHGPQSTPSNRPTTPPSAPKPFFSCPLMAEDIRPNLPPNEHKSSTPEPCSRPPSAQNSHPLNPNLWSTIKTNLIKYKSWTFPPPQSATPKGTNFPPPRPNKDIAPSPRPQRLTRTPTLSTRLD